MYNVLAEIRDRVVAIGKSLDEISEVIPVGSTTEIEELNYTMKEIRDIMRKITDK